MASLRDSIAKKNKQMDALLNPVKQKAKPKKAVKSAFAPEPLPKVNTVRYMPAHKRKK